MSRAACKQSFTVSQFKKQMIGKRLHLLNCNDGIDGDKRKEYFVMSSYVAQLRQLQAQCARRKNLEAVVSELRAQQDTYTALARELHERFLAEQADADRLEGRSLSALFYHVVGKRFLHSGSTQQTTPRLSTKRRVCGWLPNGISTATVL